MSAWETPGAFSCHGLYKRRQSLKHRSAGWLRELLSAPRNPRSHLLSHSWWVLLTLMWCFDHASPAMRNSSQCCV